MKVSKKAALAMLIAIGHKNAGDWSSNRIAKKLSDKSKGIVKLEEKDIPDEHKPLFNEIKAAVEKDEPIDIDEDVVAETKAPVTESTPATDATKAPEKAKRGPIKKAGEPGKPGILETIYNMLKGASEESPIKDEDILKNLQAAFPDRDPKGMKSSLSQAGYDLKNRGVTVHKNEKGKWATGELTKRAPAPKKEKKEEAKVVSSATEQDE